MSSWKKWWSSLQPKSRQVSGNNRKLLQVIETGEKWEDLRKGSVNGFFNIVITLVWWYSAITSPSQRKVYVEMVEDVSWVLDWLLAGPKAGMKRGATDLGKEDKVKRLVFNIVVFALI